MTKKSLNGWHVVIMRPSHQAQGLIGVLQDYQAQVCLLPLMEIEPILATQQKIDEWLSIVKECTFLVVTSANAIYCAPLEIILALKNHPQLSIVTMGKATSQALKEKELTPFFTAPPGSTSESLLQAFFFAQNLIAGKSVLILAGEGGRTILAESLQARGAKIHWLKSYQQCQTEIDMMPLLSAWQKQKQFAVVVTSSRSLEKLLALSPYQYHSWLKSCPVIVVSARIAEQAKMAGFQRVFTAASPHSEDIVDALQVMSQTCLHNSNT